MDPLTSLEPWIGFNMASGVGPVRVRRLIDHFGSLEQAWRASTAELRTAGLDERVAANVDTVRNSKDVARELDSIERDGVQVLTWDSPRFPERLLNIYNPPIMLYVRGELPAETVPAVAVVGTRKATAYGREVTKEICRGLVENDVTVISGLARGVDSCAHRAAIENHGQTVAVLACGVNVVYPPENRLLALEIIDNGCLVSEYPMNSRPEAMNFPARNRLISGLSLGTLVVEAGDRSGALITAAFALEQGRDVFAVPGNIFSNSSKGCHALIQQGAKLVRSAADIIEELNLAVTCQQLEFKALLPENDTEKAIVAVLRPGPMHIDDISRGTGLPAAVIGGTLTMMELKGLAQSLGGMNYALSARVQ
jgi:DNA processing protein